MMMILHLVNGEMLLLLYVMLDLDDVTHLHIFDSLFVMGPGAGGRAREQTWSFDS
jgi:hypothetical protein